MGGPSFYPSLDALPQREAAIIVVLSNGQCSTQHIAEHATKPPAAICLTATAEHSANKTPKAAPFATTALLCQIASNQHRQNRQHLLEQRRINARLLRSMAGHASAYIL